MHSIYRSFFSTLPKRVETVEAVLSQKLIGQSEAVHFVSRAIKRFETGFHPEKKPLAVWLFAGPTGVGKTKLAIEVANILSLPFHRYDMSEFQEKHNVARFIGSPHGYVGSTEGGGTGQHVEEDATMRAAL